MARYQQDYLVLRKSSHGSVARSFFFFNNQTPRAKCKELRKLENGCGSKTGVPPKKPRLVSSEKR